MKRAFKAITSFAAFLRAVLVLAASMLMASCQFLSSLEDDVANNTLSEPVTVDSVRGQDRQARFGAREHPRVIEANGGLYRNAEMEELIAVITGDLVSVSGETRAYEVTLLDTPKVNAFALPGGYIYITRGLLSLANDASEVAAVLSHEMAHVRANHGIERSRQVASGVLVNEVLSDVVTNDVAGAVAQSAAKQRRAAFTQRQELQADALGIRYLAQAGYDPFAAARFLDSLDRFTAWRDGASSGLRDALSDRDSSHPSTPRRIQLARRHARAIGPEGQGKRMQERYLAALNGMTFGDKASEGFVRGNTFSHVGLNFAFDVPDDFTLSNRSDGVLGEGPNEQLLRFDSVSIEDDSDPRAYLATNWLSGILPQSIQATKINGLAAAKATALSGEWRLSVTVIAHDERYYRFILATPRSRAVPNSEALAIAQSFRRLSPFERGLLRPLKIRIVTVRSRDDVARLAGRMEGVQNPLALFRALNGLDAGDSVTVGSKVKIVID